MADFRGKRPISPTPCAARFKGAREPLADHHFHGRRRGRRLRPQREELLAGLLPKLELSLPAGDNPLDPTTLFDRPVSDVWLEIGFGNGEHLIWQAERHRNVGLIGAEPFLNGVARLLAYIDEGDVDNVRILSDDVRPLLTRLPPASLGRVFILFPDPWPKARHHKRRIVSRETLDTLADIMADGAELRLATDDADYSAWMLRTALAHPAFEWLARRPGDWRRRPDDWPPTRYEQKNRSGGQGPMFLRFRRRPRG